MAKFTSTKKHSDSLTEIELPSTSTTRIHLVGVKARVVADIKLIFESNIDATIKSSPFDGPKGIWVVDIKGKSNGETKLKAEFKGEVVASVVVKTFTKIIISLPLDNTEEGMLTRLFLAESINPGNGVLYNEEESRRSMIWMRQVIQNRLTYKTPSTFGVKGITGQLKYSVTDVVKAKNQFHGFEEYPKIKSSIKVNLNGFVAIANNYNHPKRQQYVKYIENAKSAASKDALKNFSDPSSKGIYGWRTKGSSSPGGDFKKYQDLAGQTFYTIK